jgi:hypothetical protein
MDLGRRPGCKRGKWIRTSGTRADQALAFLASRHIISEVPTHWTVNPGSLATGATSVQHEKVVHVSFRGSRHPVVVRHHRTAAIASSGPIGCQAVSGHPRAAVSFLQVELHQAIRSGSAAPAEPPANVTAGVQARIIIDLTADGDDTIPDLTSGPLPPDPTTRIQIVDLDLSTSRGHSDSDFRLVFGSDSDGEPERADPPPPQPPCTTTGAPSRGLWSHF